MRTYIVIAVLHQECDAPTSSVYAARVVLQPVLCSRHIVHQLAIGKRAARQ